MVDETVKRQPIFNIPAVIRIIAIITIIIHFLQLVLSPVQYNELIRYLAFIPARFSLPDVWQFEGFWLVISPISYAFLHADGYHLLLNVFFLACFRHRGRTPRFMVDLRFCTQRGQSHRHSFGWYFT